MSLNGDRLIEARRVLTRLGEGGRLMAENYTNLNRYITEYLPPLPITPEVAFDWYTRNKSNPSPPEWPRDLDEILTQSLDKEQRATYEAFRMACHTKWVEAKSKFRAVLRLATDKIRQQQSDKDSAPQMIYAALLNAIIAFRAVKPAPPGGDWKTSKTREFFESIKLLFMEAIRQELEPLSLPIDIDYMLFRAKSVLAINIIMDLVDYPLGTKNTAWYKVRHAVSQINTPYSTQYLKILATFLVHGVNAVNRFPKGEVQFPTLELDETGLVIDILTNKSGNFEKRWGRSIYAFNISRRTLAKQGLANNGETKLLNSKLKDDSNQVAAYLVGNYWRSYPEREIGEDGKDPLAAHVRSNRVFENASVAAASAAVNAAAALADPVPVSVAPSASSISASAAPSVSAAGTGLSSILEQPLVRMHVANAASIVSAVKEAEEQVARNAGLAAAKKVAANKAEQAEQAKQANKYTAPKRGCFGLGCFGGSRKGGRRRIKKHRKTRRRSKKRSTA